MKKSFLLLVLLMAGFLFVFPSQVEATPVDMVILLDTSWSVLPSFKGMLNFIEMDIISEYLRFGDTLHFITFDEKPYLVFSRQINNRNDFEFVINHLSLLHPFGNFTDIIAAVKFLREYVSGISRNSAKKIIILTDGVHNPSYESPYESVICPRTGVNLFEREVEELERANWKVRIVLVPGDGQRESTTSRGTSRISAPAEPRTAAAQQNQAPAHGQPATPAQPAAPGTTFVQNQPPVPTPVMPTTYPETALTTAREEKEIEQAAVTTRPEISRETSPWGPWGGVIPADTDANIGYFLTNLIRTNITLPLILLLLAILLIIIAFILTTRYYSRLSVRESYNVVRNDIDSRGIDKYGNRSDSANRRPIIMKVANQNDQVVGISRNIHRFKTGTVKSIGGGNSSFLIFLYKIPGAIASLKFDGTKYIFTPLRPEFFPAIEDSEVENPLDQDIKIKTEKFQMLSVKFSEYISPLEKINSTLKLTEKRSYFYDKT